MSMAGGIFLWSGTPGGSGAFLSTAPQRDLKALAGVALLWGSVALFAPAQPTPAAAERLTGTHQLAIHQSQNRSWISRTFQAPVTAAPDIVRPFYVYEQRAENSRGNLKAPQIDALPILRALPSIGPQDPTQIAAQIWKQAPAEATVQPTLIRALSASPQTDTSQLRANLWAPATAPAPDQPAIHFLQGSPQLVDLTVRNALWGPLSVEPPPIRLFHAEPQQIDFTQQAQWFKYPPPSVAPSDPPIMPFTAGPLAGDVALYGLGRVSMWYAPPESIAPPAPPASVDGGHPARQTDRQFEQRLFRELDQQDFANPEYKITRTAVQVSPAVEPPIATPAPKLRRYDDEIMAILWMLM